MAENNLKTQLDDIVAGKRQIQKNDNFFVTLSISEADFKNLSSKDLENIESILKNCEDHDLVANIRYKIGERKKELGIADAPEVQQERQEAQPSPADSQTKEDDLPHTEFMNVPSYSLYKNYQGLVNKFNNGEANETDGRLIKDYIDNAKKIVDLAANEEVTPEQAVFLKDYLEILNSTVEEGKKYNEELEAKVDEQLKVFDEENGLGKLKDTPEHQKLLETKEKSWHEIAQSYNWDENVDNETMDVLTNLSIQELKLKDDSVITDKVYEIFAQKYNMTQENAKRVCRELINKHDAGTMKGIDEQLFGDYLNTLHEVEVDTFRQQFEDLKSQLEATRAIERTKLIAEELYPEKPGMSEEDLEEIRKKREKYLEEQLSREDGLPGKEKWIEENALRALRDKHHIADGDDEKIYEELRKAYSHIADEIDTATNTAYVLRVEALANRSARLTGADGLNPQTQKFVQDYAKKNEDSYKVGKMALSIGKSVALSRGVKYAFGFKGMAAYSAYQTSQAVKKSWAKYSESLPNGEKASLLGYCKYLKDNPKELTDIVSKVSKTAVMSSLAVAGTALGIDNVPGVSAAIVGSINAVTAAVKIHQNKDAIKNTWKNRKQIAEDFKEKHPNLKKFGKWGAALLGVAAAGYAAYKIFAPDEVKDAVDDGMSDLDKNLLDNFDGKEMTDAEREEILKNTEDLSKNSTGDITDPLNLKGGENAATETAGGENSENNAADAAQATDNYEMPQEEKDFLRRQVLGGPNSGPDPIVDKLKEMGVMTKEDEEVLRAAGSRKDGIASHALNAYLGLPADREVSVHASLTPEQQKELIEFVHSKEYSDECEQMNTRAKVAHELAKARAAAKAAKQAAAEQGAGDPSAQVVQEEQKIVQEEQKVATVNFSQNKAFAGITTKHGVDTKDVSVKEQNQAYQTIRNAARQAHADDPKFKHADATYVDKNGNEVNARVTVKGSEEKGLNIKTKVENPDGSKMKENLKLKNGVYSIKYKNAAFEDMNNDGVNDQLVAKTAYGTTSHEAYKASDGKEYVVQKEYDPNKKEWKETERHESKNAKSEVTKIAKAQRKAFEKGGR